MGSCSSSCVRQLATVVVHFYMFQDQTRDEGMDRRMDRWTAQHLWLSGLLSCRPHSLELSPRFYPGPHHQCRLFQMFAKNVFVRSILVHSARLKFSTITALYKSTYLLTYILDKNTIEHGCWTCDFCTLIVRADVVLLLTHIFPGMEKTKWDGVMLDKDVALTDTPQHTFKCRQQRRQYHASYEPTNNKFTTRPSTMSEG